MHEMTLAELKAYTRRETTKAKRRLAETDCAIRRTRTASTFLTGISRAKQRNGATRTARTTTASRAGSGPRRQSRVASANRSRDGGADPEPPAGPGLPVEVEPRDEALRADVAAMTAGAR